MHDGMEKGPLVISRKQHILICALVGLLILGGVLGLSAHSDLQNAKKQFRIPSAMLRSSAPTTTT